MAVGLRPLLHECTVSGRTVGVIDCQPTQIGAALECLLEERNNIGGIMRDREVVQVGITLAARQSS